MKAKITLSSLLLLFFVIFTSQILAVGNAYYAIVKWDNGTKHIEYRTTVRPFPATEKTLIEEKNERYNEWIQILDATTGLLVPDKEYMGTATSQTYSSHYLIFTKDTLATYTESTSSKYGYLKYTDSDAQQELVASQSAADIRAWYNTVNKTHIKANVEDKYLYNFQLDENGNTIKATLDLTSNSLLTYLDNVGNLEKYLDNILDVGTGTQTLRTGYVNEKSWQQFGETPITFTNKLVPYKEARRMLFNPNNDGENVASALYDDTLFISDIYIDEDTTEKLIEAAKVNPNIYVSAISETKSWGGEPFYMLTPENFLHAKSANVNTSNWSKNTLGTADSGWGAGLNLWDNQLLLAAEETEKTVIINHINLYEDTDYGLNKYNIDISLSNLAHEVTLYKDGKSLYDESNVAYLQTDYTSNFVEKYTLDANVTGLNVKDLTEILPNKNWVDEENRYLKAGEFELQGFTFNYGTNEAEVVSNAKNEDYYKLGDALKTSGDINFTGENASKDVVVVNVYYAEPIRNITIKHYVVGANRYIEGNKEGVITSDTTIHPTIVNPSDYAEIYKDVNISKNITFTRKQSSTYSYMGYEILTESGAANEKDEETTDIAISVKVNKDTPTVIDNDDKDNISKDIIIVFKYRLGGSGTGTGNIIVQHALYDKTDKFVAKLDGNGYANIYGAEAGNKGINPDVVKEKIEYYTLPEGYTQFTTYKLGENGYYDEYLGYEITSNVDSGISSSDVTATGTAARAEAGQVITFKYKQNKTIRITDKNNETPSPTINGTLSVQSIKSIHTNCNDNGTPIYSVPGNAIDNNKDIFVGIKQIPTYILAGMNVQQLEHKDSKVTINITIKYGYDSKTWTINVPYYLSYYAVQNILMHKFDHAKVYNTATGQDTSGASVFDTKNDNIRVIRPDNTSSLVLWAAANGNIGKTDLKTWTHYMTTSYRVGYKPTVDPNRENTTINMNPTDTIENILMSVNEDKISVSGYQRQTVTLGTNSYGVNNITLDYMPSTRNILDGDVNSEAYIKYSSQDKAGTIANLRTAFTQIELDNQANIEITLVDTTMFDRINSLKTGEENSEAIIDADDIKSRIQYTDEKIKALAARVEELKAANKAYREGCSDNGEGYTLCYDTVATKYSNKLASITGCCDGYDEEGGCLGGCTCDHYKDCIALREKYKTIAALKTDYDNAQVNYNIAKSNLATAFGQEEYALQHVDEAMYIKTELWDVYQNYTTEQIAKLLDLDIKFDYSSGGAKLVENNEGKAETELLKVNSHSIILETSATEALKSSFNNKVYLDSSYDDEKEAGDTSEGTEKDEKQTEQVYLEASRQTIASKDYYKTGIPSSWIKDDITSVNYSNNEFVIPKTKLNGKRILAATSAYKWDTTNSVGSNNGTVYDNMYYPIQELENNIIEENLFEINKGFLFKSYGKKAGGSQEFNVYTPLVVKTTVNQGIDVIDQTQDNHYKNTDIIQANSDFTIKFSSDFANNVYTYNIPSDFTSRYLNPARYYIKFEFDVDNAKYTGAKGYTKESYKAGTWIGPIYGDEIRATARINTTQGESITDISTQYYVIAAAINANSSWTDLLLRDISTNLSEVDDAELLENIQNACGTEGGQKISYYADHTGGLVIVNRIYDFRVTDLKDVDWKNVFRANTTHTQIAYYAGFSKWNTLDPTKYNEIVGRTEAEIGTSPTRVLPLGPYKNTNKAYTKAPKMGYRFSFDLKVTGAKNNDKSVTILPSFYYISKDGKTYYPEYTAGAKGIYLFYKNSNGQYVRVGSKNDNYEIKFVPSDGYRATIAGANETLSKTNITLGGLKKLTLNFKEVTTYSTNDAAITYYGEYKLPNSTIAVLVNENGTYDINKPLSNGYIGVKFDIVANETNGTALSYGKDSFIPAGAAAAKVNTSQWDYEGFLGITKPGESYTTTLRLEKGTWKINNQMYNNIKGTVILYDLDSKASNDFN